MLAGAEVVPKVSVFDWKKLVKLTEMYVFRCQDRNGSFMVETTAWEEKKAG